jgi:predicted nucleic acid-binding protein
MRRAVFDASALVKLVVPESGSPDAVRAYAMCDDQLAPEWALLECAHALWRKWMRLEYDAATIREAHVALRSIGLRLLDTDSLAGSALELALAHRHSVYDCAYLALALAEEAGLVTADTKLRDLARDLGIDVTWIGPGDP